MANTSDLQSFRFVIEGIGIPIFGGIGVIGNLLRNTSKSLLHIRIYFSHLTKNEWYGISYGKARNNITKTKNVQIFWSLSKSEHPAEMQLGPEAGSQAADHLPPHLGPAVHLLLILPLLDDTNVSRVVRQEVLTIVSVTVITARL